MEGDPQDVRDSEPILELATDEYRRFYSEHSEVGGPQFGSNIRPKRNKPVGQRVLTITVPRVAQNVGERREPLREWAPGPSHYSPRHTRQGGPPLGFNSPNADHTFSNTDTGSAEKCPGRITENRKPIYGGGRLGSLADLTLQRSRDEETPGPRFNIRSEPIPGAKYQAVTNPVYTYGSRASFDKVANRINSQGMTLGQMNTNFASGRDSGLDHPTSQKYLPMLCYDGNRIGDSTKVNFKSCLPYSSLARTGRNAYLGESYASTDNYGIHSPGPLAYDTLKVYETARRYNANGQNSKTIKYSLRPKLSVGMEFKMLEKREKELPGPGTFSPIMAKDGSHISIDKQLGVKIGTEPKLAFAQERTVPLISRHAVQDFEGKFSPGPVYYPTYGSIEAELAKKKGSSFGASSRIGPETGKTWSRTSMSPTKPNAVKYTDSPTRHSSPTKSGNSR